MRRSAPARCAVQTSRYGFAIPGSADARLGLRTGTRGLGGRQTPLGEAEHRGFGNSVSERDMNQDLASCESTEEQRVSFRREVLRSPASERIRVSGQLSSDAPRSGSMARRSERQRQEGNGRGDTVRLQASGILRGVWSRCGESAEVPRVDAQASIRGSKQRKRSEPLAGCEVQQTHSLLAEEAVEVVRNHVGGTGLSVW